MSYPICNALTSKHLLSLPLDLFFMYIKMHYNLFYIFMLSTFLPCICFHLFSFFFPSFLHKNFGEDIGVTQLYRLFFCCIFHVCKIWNLQIDGEGVQHCLFLILILYQYLNSRKDYLYIQIYHHRNWCKYKTVILALNN